MSADTAPSEHAQRSSVWRVVRYYLMSVLALLHVITGGPVALGRFALIGLFVAGIALVPAFGAGFLFIVPVMMLATWFARLDRARLAATLGVALPTPPQTPGPWWRRALLNPHVYKAQAYLAVTALWSAVAFTAVMALLLAAAAFVADRAGQAAGYADVAAHGRAAGHIALAVVVCVAMIVVLPLLARLLCTVEVWLARLFISVNVDEEIRSLSARITTLSSTREAAIASVVAERRRIERDLHDGPQQSLTALAMDLGIALRMMPGDPDGARELVQRAHSGAKQASSELRAVIRNIHPPVLTEQGLVPALTALAARCPVPTQVHSTLEQRVPHNIETVLYFCVSEALSNAVKHARANSIGVNVDSERDAIVVSVTDDGVGGAGLGHAWSVRDAAAGTGLDGLVARLSGIDGQLAIDSPRGGPTELRFTVPAALTSTASPGGSPRPQGEPS